MNKTDTYEYETDTHVYALDINKDLKRFEKLVLAWTHRASRMVSPTYNQGKHNLNISFGNLGLTFEDIKQEMNIVVWSCFKKYNNLVLESKVPNSKAYYIAMVDTNLKHAAIRIYEKSNTIKSGKNIKYVNGSKADRLFYGQSSEWNVSI